jgi:uncharacterized protein YhaN
LRADQRREYQQKTRALKKEIEALEKSIHEAEAERAQVLADLESGKVTSYSVVNQHLTALQETIDEKTARWEEASTQLQQVEQELGGRTGGRVSPARWGPSGLSRLPENALGATRSTTNGEGLPARCSETAFHREGTNYAVPRFARRARAMNPGATVARGTRCGNHAWAGRSRPAPCM